MVRGLLIAACVLSAPALSSTVQAGERLAPRAAELRQSYADSLAAVLPGIVQIVRSPDSERQVGPTLAHKHYRQAWPGARRRPAHMRSDGSDQDRIFGSGVIVDARKGLIITNQHVVEDSDEVELKLADGRTAVGKVVGGDSETDIALVKIDADHLAAVPQAPTPPRVGDIVFAVGFPFGLKQTISMGVVSGLSRKVDDDGYQDFIQTDAAVNPGNSGGALLNARGELIGINSAGYSPTEEDHGNIGINYAVPLRMALAVVGQLSRYGDVRRGYLGAGYQSIEPELALALGAARRGAVLITRIAPGSPAEKAGLAVGDIVTAANGTALVTANDLRNVVGLTRTGQPLHLDVRRGASSLAIAVTPRENALTRDQVGFRGATLALSKTHDTVAIVDVEPDSPADSGGLQPGDIVERIDSTPVQDIAAVMAWTKTDKSVSLSVRRNDTRAIVIVGRH